MSARSSPPRSPHGLLRGVSVQATAINHELAIMEETSNEQIGAQSGTSPSQNTLWFTYV